MSHTEIKIPEDLADKNLSNFFQWWRWYLSPRPGPVTFDFRLTNFIAPWAITLFSAYGLWLREIRGRKVRVLINSNTEAGYYLFRTGFAELFGESASAVSILKNDRTTRLTRITRSDEIAGFAADVMRLLQIDDPEMEGAVRYSLIELLRNVVQHAHSPIGGIAMAQYYPNTGLVELVVADMGVGIKATLQPNYPEIDDDFKALKFATQPHVSGTFSPNAYAQMRENAGLGLFFIKQIATLSGGGFFLASGKFLENIWGDAEGRQRKKYRDARNDGWPGTFAVLQLKRETIVDFDSVLHVCRKLAEQARKDPTELSLDFLDDIPALAGLVVVRVGEFEENVEEAARVRDSIIEPSLAEGKIVVLDFSGIRFATQSFVHALMYKILRDSLHIASGLSIANCTRSTREAILAVAGYARVSDESSPRK